MSPVATPYLLAPYDPDLVIAASIESWTVVGALAAAWQAWATGAAFLAAGGAFWLEYRAGRQRDQEISRLRESERRYQAKDVLVWPDDWIDDHPPLGCTGGLPASRSSEMTAVFTR